MPLRLGLLREMLLAVYNLQGEGGAWGQGRPSMPILEAQVAHPKLLIQRGAVAMARERQSTWHVRCGVKRWY